MTNNEISAAREGSGEDKYWLGETFEDRIRDEYVGEGVYGLLILPLNDSSSGDYQFGNHKQEAKYASTSWSYQSLSCFLGPTSYAISFKLSA